MTDEQPKKKRRGFAAMSLEKQFEIAQKGGIAAHKKGTAHKWTKESAKAAGAKGGKASGYSRKLSSKPDDQEQSENLE